MTHGLKRGRWLLLLTGLLFAVASVQSAVAVHAAELKPMSSDMNMANGADHSPCHQSPVKSSHGKEPDCCASDLTCFNKCSSAVVAISVGDADHKIELTKAVFRPVAWTDVTPKPPTHPPSA